MTDFAVRLAEWQTVSPIPGSPTEGVGLGDDPSVRDLARRLSDSRMLEVQELRTGLSVRSTSFVGRVRLGDIDITVVPKLRSDALLSLLRYAYGLRNLQVGHSFLMEAGKPVKDAVRFFRVVRDEIIPLLEEYCYEDYDALHAVLGGGLVDLMSRAIRHDLFDEPVGPELVQALLSPCPDILTSLTAMTTVGTEPDEVETDEDEAGAAS